MSHRAQRPLLLGMALIIVGGLTGTAAAQLPNITYHTPMFWQYPVLPTTAYCPLGNMYVPATLPGNSGVNLNYAGINDGFAVAYDFFTSIQIDGAAATLQWHDSLPQGGEWVGCGTPWSVRGGRHTFEVIGDLYDEVVESDETDNSWAHQFVFTPYVLSESVPKTRGAPPKMNGGMTSIIDGSPAYFNCDGFGFNSSGWWNAIVLYAEDDVDDYDLELFPPSTGSEDGFWIFSAGSWETEGHLDAVIVNRNTVPVQDFDVGVYNYSEGTGQFVIEQVISEPAFVGDSIVANLGGNEYLRIWDTYFGDLGWITVSVTDSSPGSETLYVGLIEQDATETNLQVGASYQLTDEEGKAWLHKDITTTGYYGLVVYRNPSDGGLAKTIHIDIELTTPDLKPHLTPGHHAPLVPTPVQQFGSPVVLPDTLHGFIPETYFNFAIANDSPVASPGVDVSVVQDGMSWVTPYITDPLTENGTWEMFGISGREVPGGRHVLYMDADYTNAIQEFNEDNNNYGEQYCWSPLELIPGGQHSQFSPGWIYGGWSTIDSDVTIYPNCDGYRLATGATDWEGLVLTQGPNSDYDLSIHHALVGVKEGFDDYLDSSHFSSGKTDYVLFNNNILAAGVYDIGVENIGGGEDYTIEAVGSTSLPVPVSGRHGPYSMPVANMLHLYNVYLEQDLYAFRLDNLAGMVDWGMALHSHDIFYQSRHDSEPGGSAYLNGPGDAEFFTMDIPVAGWYGLAVFKTGPFEFDKDGTYRLTIMQGISDVPDVTDLPDLPKATALAGIHPNPFNPRTEISFELATAATVELAIYDLKGARVRRLVSEPMPAGRHQVVWNGEDDTGQRVASGVYLARFTAGDHHQVKKVVMVK